MGKITIYIDDVPYETEDGQSLLSACLSLGFNIPYFCWHPALHSVGACRQCAVKQFRSKEDTRGFITMSCMTPASDGTRISIDDPEALAFRKSVIEFLMMNHPHDCPVCDEGGECHLQDMTVMLGHNYREFRFPKRTYQNQDLGPFLNHEMNRCIQCYRCVRFYRDYAGGRDLNVFGVNERIFFGRSADGTLENEFSGNLVEVCPTGVFTDKTLRRHYTRKWDLQTAPSICVHCGVGCNTIAGERYGTLRRIRNRYNGEVNGYFLCDRGRYGYDFVNSDRRILRPLVRQTRSSAAEPGDRASAMERIVAACKDGASVIGIGSPRATLEANFALRTLVGPERFFLGIPEREKRLLDLVLEVLTTGPAPSPSLQDMHRADAVLVLGEDVTNTAPMVALALRQSVRLQPMKKCDRLGVPRWADAAVRETVANERGPLYVATTAATKLDEIARQTLHAAPDNLARFGFAVARDLSSSSPEVSDLAESWQSLARAVADDLRHAQRPLVVAGTSCGSEALILAAANVAWALREQGVPADLSFVVPECNSLGLAMMGGASLDEALRNAPDMTAETVIVLENDLYRRAAPVVLDDFLGRAGCLVCLDHLANRTTAAADVVLPAGTFSETTGTMVNSEGRAQRLYRVFSHHDEVGESWSWLRDIMQALGRTEGKLWKSLDNVTGALATAIPACTKVTAVAPPAGFRMNGMKIPRQSHRYSGRTSMLANVTMHEPKPPDDPDSPLAFSMEGSQSQPPAALIPRFWSPGWNSIQSVNKFQSEIEGPLRGGDPGVRLIEPLDSATARYFSQVPPAFEPRDGQWLLVPCHHIFGSGELSVLSPGIAERSPGAYLALGPEDAARMSLSEGDAVQVRAGDREQMFPLKVVPGLPAGVAGMPVGLAGSEYLALPAWCTVQRGKE